MSEEDRHRTRKRWQQFEKFSTQNYSERCVCIELKRMYQQTTSAFIRTIIAYFNNISKYTDNIFMAEHRELDGKTSGFEWVADLQLQRKTGSYLFVLLFHIQSEEESGDCSQSDEYENFANFPLCNSSKKNLHKFCNFSMVLMKIREFWIRRFGGVLSISSTLFIQKSWSKWSWAWRYWILRHA